MTESRSKPMTEQSAGLVIIAVAVTMLLASLGQTIVSTALPVIVRDLGGLEHLTWVVVAYLLSSTVVAPIYGKLGDLFGRKIVLQTAIVIFLMGAALSAMATSMTFLIAARLVQGLGGGGLLVVAMTVVADVIPARQRGRVQGMLAGVFGFSTVVGPLLGGLLVQGFSWRWIFLVNMPLGLLALAVISIVLRSPPRQVSHKIDYAGFALLSGTLTTAVLYSSLGGVVLGWTSPPMLLLLALFATLLLAFIQVERRAAEPVLPMNLFRNNTFVVVNTGLVLVGITMFGTITFIPMYLQVAKGISPVASGVQLLPMMAGMISASALSGQIMTRTGRYRMLPIASTFLLTLGLILLGTMELATPSWLVALYMLMVGVGIGPTMTVGVTAVQNAVSPDKMGIATASVTLFRQIGGSIGVSLFGAIFSHRLALEMGPAALEGGTRSAFDPATMAALSVVERNHMLEAFAAAMHPVFFVAAGAGLGAFLLSLLLRELPLATMLRKESEPGPSESGSVVACASAPKA